MTLCVAMFFDMHDAGSARLQLLEDAWSECAGEWSKSTLYRKITKKNKVSEHGARVWLTRSQLITKYNSEQMADCIIAAKSTPELFDTQTKPHPDCPQEEAGLAVGNVGCRKPNNLIVIKKMISHIC